MAEERKEVIPTESEIDKKLDGIKDDSKKIDYLKGLLRDDKFKRLRKHVIKKIVPLLLKKDVASYKLVYDSMGEGLEPIYFWILDFMRDRAPGGLGLDVKKLSEETEASATSGYFGEMGARATQMQQKAAEYLGLVNQVIKSIVNLLYDLKEFKMRIAEYDKANSKDLKIKDEGEQVLKTIWMDQVDVKKGRGSINMLAQDLRFVTLRDAFFYVKNTGDLDKPGVDLNERVKRILRTKLEEFTHWKEFSEKEIRKRYEIERAYLKAQKGTLHLYASWVKPYLKTAQKLKMKEFNTPDIVEAFSNVQMKLDIYGYKEIKLDKVHESYASIKLGTNMYVVIAADLEFRSVPQSLQGQGGRHYLHGGRVDMTFKGYVMDDTEMEAVKSMEFYEDLDLVEEWVGQSLEVIEDEIDEYFNPKEEKKEIKKIGFENPFAGTLSGFKDLFFSQKSKKIGGALSVGKSKFYIGKLKEQATKDAKDLTFTLYNTYKKTHRMINW